MERNSYAEMYIEEEDVTACKGSIQTTDAKEGFAHSTPSLDMTTLSSKEKFGSMKTIESSDNIIKSFPKEFDDVNGWLILRFCKLHCKIALWLEFV